MNPPRTLSTKHLSQRCPERRPDLRRTWLWIHPLETTFADVQGAVEEALTKLLASR